MTNANDIPISRTYYLNVMQAIRAVVILGKNCNGPFTVKVSKKNSFKPKAFVEIIAPNGIHDLIPYNVTLHKK